MMWFFLGVTVIVAGMSIFFLLIHEHREKETATLRRMREVEHEGKKAEEAAKERVKKLEEEALQAAKKLMAVAEKIRREQMDALVRRGNYACGFEELPDISLAKKPRYETVVRCNACGGEVVPSLCADRSKENRCGTCGKSQMNWKPANKADKPTEEKKP